MLFLLSYIILGTFHPLLVIVETRTFTFHLVSSTTPFSIAVSKHLHCDLATSHLPRFTRLFIQFQPQANETKSPHSRTPDVVRILEWEPVFIQFEIFGRMLPGFRDWSQFASLDGCCLGLEPVFRFSREVTARADEGQQETISLACNMNANDAQCFGFQTGFIETPRNLRTLCLCDL